MSGQLSLPPGFRFHPTDEELVTHYLCRKCASQSISVPIIKDIDLYKYDPWQLPGMALYGEKEWYFFSPRDRKYPNGSRPNRSAGTGYWKATGADKPIGKPKTVGIKKALVFYAGKAPKGVKTNWIMHEYRLANVDRSAGKKNINNSRLDDWVLCRIYNKKGSTEKQYTFDQKPGKFVEKQYTFDQKPGKFSEIREIKPEIMSSMGINQTPPLPQAVPLSVQPPPMMNDYIHFDSSESIPRLHTESSCSEQVLSPDFTWNKEVQSEPKLNGMDYQYNYMDTFPDDPFGNQTQFGMDQFSPFYDMFMNLQKSL